MKIQKPKISYIEEGTFGVDEPGYREFSHGSDPQTGVDDAARSRTETDRHSISFVNSEVRKPFPEFRLMYSSARFQFDLEPGSFYHIQCFYLV